MELGTDRVAENSFRMVGRRRENFEQVSSELLNELKGRRNNFAADERALEIDAFNRAREGREGRGA